MKSYTILQLNSGRYAVIDKKSLCVYSKHSTREEAVEQIKTLKESDKKALEEKRYLKIKVNEAIKENVDKFIFEGSNAILRSYTESGKTVTLISNCGLELRSRKCYTLYIDGEYIFTSGTIQAAMEYMIKN